MPKLEPRQVQKELEQGQLWPVYWLYGHERMKARELLKRIRRAALGEESEKAGSLLSLSEERIDGADSGSTAARVIEAAQSLSFGGGTRFVVVTDAHALKESETLAELLPEKAKALPKADVPYVCVFLSKDLDARKKFSKLLLERAAVVPCEEVLEGDRESWIQYLAKRRGIQLPAELALRLVSLDPWSLDIIDQELEKYSLSPEGDVLLEGDESVGPYGSGTDAFVQAFFLRDAKEALRHAHRLSESPEEGIPLLGLLAWNSRQLEVLLAQDPRAPRPKMNPYLAEKMARWAAKWKLSEVIELQSALAELDFGMKQKPVHPLGLWSSLITQFCLTV